jgi:hypothetical protein
MGHGIDIHNPFVVNLFHHHMSVQLMVILAFALLFSVAALIRNLSRLDVGFRESRGRTFMRVGLGLLWLLDGLLQIQGDMPLGLASQVLDGSKDQSPSWMHGPINVAVNLWNQHPVALATSVTWIQIGIGLLLIASSRRLGRMAAAFSVLWAFVVWVTAGCGGVLGSEASLLFGWPGAPVFYGVMGVLVALEPATFQHAARLTSSKVMGIVLVLGGLIQLRPGTGAWSQGSANAINAMVSDMTSAHQPGLLRHVVRAMGTIARATGPGLNLAVALGAIGLGVAWWVARSGPTRRLVALTGMSALVVWVLVQDTGLFGGLSTDPNSMLPLALLAFSNLPSLRTEEPWRDVLGVAFRRGVGSSIASIGSAQLKRPSLRRKMVARRVSRFPLLSSVSLLPMVSCSP